MGQSWVSPEGQHDQADEYGGYQVMTVEEINKIQLGKLIIKYCGHEGTDDNEQTASIRKLLQEAITNLEPKQEQYPGVWRDAELKIFDLYGNGYVVKSGQGSVKFVAQITGKGDVELSKIKDESWWTSMKALVMRQNTPQLSIEGPPDQSNASRGWFSFLSSSRPSSGSQNQVEGVSPMIPGSPGEDGDGAPHGEHQDQSLSGHDGDDGLLNNSSSSSSSSNPQPTDNQPSSEGQTGRNDISGSASQVQIQPTEATGGSQTDKKEEGGSTICNCHIG
uniref:Uncharacterized protein n=1 Tax=Branchiostoma floridae TaxID=7739 RepID=C3YZ55_BRAFL|eukprot:XP_002598551.1 hypothetical protein BRAFLDRAFT_66942 [Branchiostoma floridae]